MESVKNSPRPLSLPKVSLKNWQNKSSLSLYLKQVFLLGVSILFAFPFLWMVLGIFKTNNEIWQEPYQLLPDQWNLSQVIDSLGRIQFERYMFNSLLVGILGSLLILLAATLFTYAIVFMKGKFSRGLFLLVLGTYMLPSAVTYVPSYVLLAEMSLLDSLSGLVFSNLASVFAVFYLRQSFMKMSREYIEAARIDGAGHGAILRHVVFPLNKPAFFTVFSLTFIQQYNSYMWPSIMLTSDDKYLISQGLRQFFIQDGAYGMNWSEVMLASTVAILPVVILLIMAQKWFITGIMQDSGLK